MPQSEKPGPPWRDRSWRMPQSEKPGLGQGLGQGLTPKFNLWPRISEGWGSAEGIKKLKPLKLFGSKHQIGQKRIFCKGLGLRLWKAQTIFDSLYLPSWAFRPAISSLALTSSSLVNLKRLAKISAYTWYKTQQKETLSLPDNLST